MGGEQTGGRNNSKFAISLPVDIPEKTTALEQILLPMASDSLHRFVFLCPGIKILDLVFHIGKELDSSPAKRPGNVQE